MKMLELELVIHTRLSSILETLANAAVAEITSLIKEYSVLLRLELSREKQDKELSKTNGIESAQRTGWGYRAADRRVNNASQIGATPRQTPECGDLLGSNGQVAATPGCGWINHEPAAGTKVGAKASLTGVLKTEPQLVIKQEELEEDLEPQLELRMKAPDHFNISPVREQQQQPTDQQVFEEEWQFQSLSAEGTDEPSESPEHESDPGLIQLTVEHRPGMLHNPEQLARVESDNLRSGAELGLELHQGTLSATYPDYGALSLGNTSTETSGSGLYHSYTPENPSTTNVTLEDPVFRRRHAYSGRGGVAISGHQRARGGSTAPSCGGKEGRFVCKDCGKCFPYPSILQRHVLIHTGERSHVCRVCGRSFIRKSHLRRHEKLHAKRGPACPQRFQSALLPHRQTEIKAQTLMVTTVTI